MPLSPRARNGLLVLLLVNVAAVGGILYEIGYFDDDDPPSTSTTVTATLILNFTEEYAPEGAEEGMLVFEDVTTNESTVFGLLMAAAEAQGFNVTYSTTSLGVFVDSIYDVENNADDNDLWWQYTLNRVYGDQAANRKAIQNGDLIIWNYGEYEG